jgi:hypothetical protein
MEPEAVGETGAEALKMSSCIPTDACDSPKKSPHVINQILHLVISIGSISAGDAI